MGYGRELLRIFGIAKRNPDTVTWDGDTLSLDGILVMWSEVKLPGHMKGRLAAEEWRFLLEPSIVYLYMMVRNRNWGLPHANSVAVVGRFSRSDLSSAPDLQITDHAYANELLFILIIGYVAFEAVVIASYTNWLFRSVTFASDPRAAERVGA